MVVKFSLFVVFILGGLFIFGVNKMHIINPKPSKSQVRQMKKNSTTIIESKNVLGTELQSCCTEPLTGFYRDGFCSTGDNDYGVHVVCAVVTEDFLSYSKSMGNDLTQALPPPSSFSGLKPGDKWCLCASRWVEAMREGHAPKILLESTHEKTLEFVDMETLKRFAH